jgi:hypothetical protein
MNRLSLFYDISGRVTKASKYNDYFSVGGIIIPTIQEDRAKKVLSVDLPKWKNATADSLSIIEKAIKDFHIDCTVVTFNKSSSAYEKFCNDGDVQHQKMASFVKGKVGFAKPGTVMRYLAFGRCSAVSVGTYLRVKGRPTILDPKGFSILYLKVVCDSDIQGEENQKAFVECWKRWGNNSKLQNNLQIKPYIKSVEFKTEQEEPLILIPDYIAGSVQYYFSTNHVHENLSSILIKEFVTNLINRKELFVVDFVFDEEFPDLTAQLNGTF